MGQILSADGAWWWDGRQWRAVLAEPAATADPFWWTHSPAAFERIALTGLILLIPIAGSMVLYGWTLQARDHLRAGRWDLPRAGFQHLRRGVPAFLALFVYRLIQLVVALVPALIVFAAVQAWSGTLAGVVAGVSVGLLVSFALGLLLAFALLAILDLADGAGSVAALNPLAVTALARTDPRRSLGGGLTFLLGSLAAVGVGSVIPFGSVLAVPAAYALLAPQMARFNRRPSG